MQVFLHCCLLYTNASVYLFISCECDESGQEWSNEQSVQGDVGVWSQAPSTHAPCCRHAESTRQITSVSLVLLIVYAHKINDFTFTYDYLCGWVCGFQNSEEHNCCIKCYLICFLSILLVNIFYICDCR